VTRIAIDELAGALEEVFASARAGRGARVAALLAAYARAHEDWRAFGLFDDDCYTRNLIARGPCFELLVLCWGAGQESPIHNHEGQDCWMAVLEGSVEEVRFDLPASGHRGPLDAQATLRYDAGQVAFIRDEMGLHLVRGAVRDERAVSLHLYAAPYDACNCYCPDTGEVTRKTLTNHSERGKVLPASMRARAAGRASGGER
jgi:cysteine dioxygenase